MTPVIPQNTDKVQPFEDQFSKAVKFAQLTVQQSVDFSKNVNISAYNNNPR